MIITCPHCRTRYQVAEAAIGIQGRAVVCARCEEMWRASAPRPALAVRPPLMRLGSEKRTWAADEERLDGEFEKAQHGEAMARRVTIH